MHVNSLSYLGVSAKISYLFYGGHVMGIDHFLECSEYPKMLCTNLEEMLGNFLLCINSGKKLIYVGTLPINSVKSF
jgi:hypothetical protein